MGCPEVEDWETEGSMDVRTCARVWGGQGRRRSTYLITIPKGQWAEGGVKGEEEALDKRESS